MKKYLITLFFILQILCILPIKQTVFAEEQVSVTVYYHRNMDENDTVVESFTYTSVGDVERFRPIALSNPGYVLVGYSEDPNSDTIDYVPLQYISYYWILGNSPEKHLYARWEKIDKQYGGVIFIGDSYVGTSSWPRYTAEELGLKSYVVSDRGGTGFVNVVSDYDGNPSNFLTLLKDAYIMAGEDNVSQYKWIIVEGGYNDQYYDYQVVIDRIGEFAEEAKALFPKARIAIGMSGHHVENTEVNYMLEKMATAYQSACKQYGISYLDGVDKVFKENEYAYFFEDFFHPNEEGGKRIGLQTAKAIQKIEKEKNPLTWIGLSLLLILAFLSALLVRQQLLMNARKKMHKR